ncbi:MAG: HAD hydrolase-like protein [Candidatus Woesearchaeota archaeon]|nr:HAD hydrolase-like protein [Candidatus Woesearchaeota archaeon]
MARKAAVVFDFDNTIANTFHIVFSHTRRFLQERGYPTINEADVRAQGMRETIQELRIPFWKLPYYVWRIKKEMKEDMKSAHVYAGLLPVLKKLQKKYSIGIVTSNRADVASHVLGMSVAFVRESSLFGKHKILKKLSRTYSFVYVGDEVRDVEACKKAGVPCIAVTWGYNTKEALEQAKPAVLVDTPKDILEAVRATL